MQFTADQVFGMVMAAHRINDGYFKEDQRDHHTGLVTKTANKLMIRGWVRAEDLSRVTAEDIVKGQEVRGHFRGYMLMMLAGKLNEFQQQAYKISQKDAFTERDSLELAIAACLPSVYERDRQHKEFMAQLKDSQQIQGRVGDRVEGEAVILSTRFNINFCKYRVQAKIGESFVDFWHATAPAVGSTVQLRGKIKALRADNSTQLNYVKIQAKSG